MEGPEFRQQCGISPRIGGVEKVAAGNISSAAYASGNGRIVGASEPTDMTTHRLV